MRTKTILSILLVITISCNQAKKSKIERDNEPDVYSLEETDEEMNLAIMRAAESFNLFEELFINDSIGKYYFSIKQKYETPKGNNEHIWVGKIFSSESEYFGTIENEPLNISNVKLGDTVKIDVKKLSDWLVIDNSNGKITGGFTIKVLRERMSKVERDELDRNNELIFDE